MTQPLEIARIDTRRHNVEQALAALRAKLSPAGNVVSEAGKRRTVDVFGEPLSPQQVVEKILWEHEVLGHDRFLAQIGLGGLPFADTAAAIELLATEVLPVVRRELAPAPATAP